MSSEEYEDRMNIEEDEEIKENPVEIQQINRENVENGVQVENQNEIFVSADQSVNHQESNENQDINNSLSSSSYNNSVQIINDRIQQKIEEIQKEIEAVMNGTHIQFKQEIIRLENEKTLREKSAQDFLQVKMKSIQEEYESELLQLETTFNQQIQNLKQTMIDSLITQQKNIEETGQIVNDEEFMSQIYALSSTNVRKLRRRAKDDVKAIGSINYNPTRRNYAVGLKINYKLSNQEISQDLGMIRDGRS